MDRTALFRDMLLRTQGDVYLGVIGPVRTGKSTFIKRFAETLMLPNIDNEFTKNRLIDELPQSGSGRTVMTTQPKFVPNEAVEIALDETMTARLRLVDCVGFLVPGAIGSEEEGEMRMVTTPWFSEDIPFEQAAEIGTRKVIEDHATVGVVVLTDGTITDIPRENYLEAEQKCMQAVRATGKPYIILLNTADPNGDLAVKAAEEIESAYGVKPMIVDLLHLSEHALTGLLTEILYAFPLKMIELSGPSFLNALDEQHPVLSCLIQTLAESVRDVHCMRDTQRVADAFSALDFFQSAEVQSLELGSGKAVVGLRPEEGVFYSVLSDTCGITIRNDYELMAAVNDYVKAKKAYDRLSAALDHAAQTGYGIVEPDPGEMEISAPELFRSGNKYGVRLHARANGMHLIRIDVESDIEPLIGTEQQSKDLMQYLIDSQNGDGDAYLNTNLFGKSLHDLILESIQGRSQGMNEQVQQKLQGAIQRIVNDGCNGMICIML